MVNPLIHERDVSLIFGSTNVGKSILSVQLGMNISQGQSSLIFENPHNPMKVLYLDLELSLNQFNHRYPNGCPENFIRLDKTYFDAEEDDYMNVFGTRNDNQLNHFIYDIRDNWVKDEGVKVLIIDNIFSFIHFVNMKHPVQIIKFFKGISHDYGVTTILVGHTKKVYGREPLTIQDLYGDSNLSNSLDSAVVIGQSMMKSKVKYLKQVKSRNGEIVYDENRVIEVEQRTTQNGLIFEHNGRYTPEIKHLFNTQERRDEEDLRILKEMRRIRRFGRISYQNLSKRMNISQSRLWRIDKRLQGFPDEPEEDSVVDGIVDL